MPKILPIQNDFTAGILSPRLHSRSDLAEYRSGVADAVNFVALRHGPMETRAGLRHVQSFGSSAAGKLFSFQLSPDSALGDGFPVVIDGANLTVFGTTSAIQGTNIVANSSFDSGSASWETINSPVVFENGRARITADPTLDVGVSQMLSVEQNAEHLIQVISPRPAGFDVSPAVQVSVGTTKGGSDVLAKTNSLTVAFNSGANTQVWVNVTLKAGTYESEIDGESGNLFEILGTPTRSVESVSVRAPSQSAQQVQFAHPWTSSTIKDLAAVMSPSGNVMYILSGALVPYKLSYDVSIASWSFGPVAFTSPPAEWVDGSWPIALTFFQDRSWWGGAAGKPAAFVASKTGEYENLTTGANANDALDFTLSRRGRIQWMEGVRNLIIGTTNGEYIVTATNGVVAPNDILVEQQSANGGARVSSEPIGNLVLYSSLDGRKLRSTSYRWNDQAWVSRDLMFSAEHLTAEDRIVEISYAKDPESIIWCTTESGGIFGCTFEPFSERLGWHRHLTDGTILSTTVLETSEGSELYALVRRNNIVRLEILDDRLSADAGQIIVNSSPSTQVSNVSHLANRTVSAVVDGAVHPDLILDETGSGVLEWEGTEIQVGLPIEASIVTLPPDYGSLRGSAMGHTKRWSSITLRLYSSLAPLINGYAAPERSTETPMDAPEPYRDFDVTVKNVGWGDGKITISQSLPVKTRISGVFGDLNQEKL